MGRAEPKDEGAGAPVKLVQERVFARWHISAIALVHSAQSIMRAWALVRTMVALASITGASPGAVERGTAHTPLVCPSGSEGGLSLQKNMRSLILKVATAQRLVLPVQWVSNLSANHDWRLFMTGLGPPSCLVGQGVWGAARASALLISSW